MIDRTFWRFLLVGIGNTVLGLGTIFAARQFVPDLIANAIGYLVVVPVSFLTHRDISFRDGGSRLGAFLRYMPVVAMGYGINVIALTSSMSIGVNGYVAQSIAILCHVVTTYTLSRIFVFLQIDRGNNHGTQRSALS